GGLFGGALRELLCCGGELLTAGGNVVGSAHHIAHNHPEFLDHFLKRFHELIFRATLFNIDHQVAAGHLTRIGCDCIDCIDQYIEVVLDGIEIAIIVVGDSCWHVPLADAIHVVCCYIERPNNRIKGFVDTGDNFLKVTLM